ncbi:MAG: response regulator [Proteobacteria bacterium]|nr:response regulator [Pseudomonadota bacterium]MBU1736730.1 response regulator [Pseudomonadota bacterium]
MNTKSVLIVDDDMVLCRTLEIQLELAGHSARSTFTGDGGIFIARHWQPDLVLLDINLPDQSGFTVLPKIRKESTGTKIIMMSACSHQEFARMHVHPGEIGFLKKPLDLGALLKILHTP